MPECWCMAGKISTLSRPMRVGILGAASAVGAHGFNVVIGDGYLGSTVGGALSAAIANQLLSTGFSGLSRIALVGAVAGYTGRLVSNRLAPAADRVDDVPFRALLGLVLGGSVGAISTDRIAPPEIKLLS